MVQPPNWPDVAAYRHCQHTVASAGATEERTVDETGQPGGVTPGENGNGAGPHGDSGGHARLNGWAAADAVWSNAGAALEPASEPVQPSWRPSRERGPGDNGVGHGWADASPRYADLLSPLSPATPPGSPPPAQAPLNGSTYALPAAESTPVALRVPASAPPYPYEGDLEDAGPLRPVLPPIPAERPVPPAERDSLPPVLGAPRGVGEQVLRAPRGVGEQVEPSRHAVDDTTPAGGLPVTGAAAVPRRSRLADLGESRDRPASLEQSRDWPADPEQSFPGWRERAQSGPNPPPAVASAEGAASGYDVPPGFRPQPVYEGPPYDTSMYERPTSPPPSPGRSASWSTEWPSDPGPEPPSGTDTRRRTVPTESTPDPPASPADGPPPSPPSSRRAADPAPDALPQRVPAEPDVPTVPEPPAAESPADAPDLTRIWSHLRRDDVQPRERPEGFDVKAILAAVRGVEGVRDASLRTTPAGAHSLRLDLSDGADPAEVSRIVARLLQDRMGLAAAPQGLPPAEPTRPRAEATATASYPPAVGSYAPAPASYVPAQPQPGTRPATEPATTWGGPAPEAPRRRASRRAYAEAEGTEAAPLAEAIGTPYPMGQSTPAEVAPPRPLNPGASPGPRVVIDEVQVSTFGLDATVEVRLAADDRRAIGRANGPAVDAYVLRLCAGAAASAVDDLLSTAEQVGNRGKCFVEHTAVVPFGSCEVAIVVVLLMCGGWVEQLAGSALVAGDPRQAVVRATLAAVNRRLEALLS